MAAEHVSATALSQGVPDVLAAQASGTSGLPPVLCYEELLAAEAGAEQGFRWVDVDENDACGLCYTSGTTGRPKARLLLVDGCSNMATSVLGLTFTGSAAHARDA